MVDASIDAANNNTFHKAIDKVELRKENKRQNAPQRQRKPLYNPSDKERMLQPPGL
jgi:hypothetical protein